MKSHYTSENTSFDFLKDSGEFMNLVLSNITSCVLLLDKNLEIQSFNDPMKTIFSNKANENILYQKCGNAIGCAYTVEEKKECGETSQCKKCEIRIAALTSYSTKSPVYKKHFSREFFTTESKKELKHLQFSTRQFSFAKGNYIILIVEDITKLINQQSMIKVQKEKLDEYLLKKVFMGNE
ncbi:hypothetical protein ACFLRY_03405 [Bacteroidota bacterium]